MWIRIAKWDRLLVGRRLVDLSRFTKLYIIKKYIIIYLMMTLKILNKVLPFSNILQFRFTSCNMHSSIFIQPQKLKDNRLILLFTVSLGVFKKLYDVPQWKKKNNNYKILVSTFFVKMLYKLKFKPYWLNVINIKQSFYTMLLDLSKINFKYLRIFDKSCYSKIKVKKKTYIKRRFSRKMTYNSFIKY